MAVHVHELKRALGLKLSFYEETIVSGMQSQNVSLVSVSMREKWISETGTTIFCPCLLARLHHSISCVNYLRPSFQLFRFWVKLVNFSNFIRISFYNASNGKKSFAIRNHGWGMKDGIHQRTCEGKRSSSTLEVLLSYERFLIFSRFFSSANLKHLSSGLFSNMATVVTWNFNLGDPEYFFFQSLKKSLNGWTERSKRVIVMKLWT